MRQNSTAEGAVVQRTHGRVHENQASISALRRDCRASRVLVPLPNLRGGPLFRHGSNARRKRRTMRSFSSSSTFLSSPAGCPGSPCDTNRLPSPPGVSPPSRHPPGDEPDVTYRELTCPRISPERPVRCELARVPARAYPEEPGTLGGDLGGSKGRPSALQFPTNSGRLRWPGKPADARRRGDPPLPSEPVHQSVAAGAPYRKSEKTFPGASTWLSVVGTSRKVVSLFGSGARTGRRQARSRQSGFRAQEMEARRDDH